MIDIGANLTHEYFSGRIDDTIAEAAAEGVEHIIVTGTDLTSSSRARELTATHGRLSFTAGIHPHSAVPAQHPDLDAVSALWAQTCCVAVGELGLDYNRMYQGKKQQQDCFSAQLEMSAATALPLFLHMRDAEGDFIDIISALARDRKKVVHCYTSGPSVLKKLLDLDAMIGITGWICDERRNQDLIESLKYLPADRIMIESDAPWLMPRTVPNFRRIRHNHPRYLRHVLDQVAASKGLDGTSLASQIRASTIAFFALDRIRGDERATPAE